MPENEEASLKGRKARERKKTGRFGEAGEGGHLLPASEIPLPTPKRGRKQVTGVTQAELATRLGLSRSTVAAALNPQSTVQLKPSTRERIVQAAERMGYRPHRYAQIMRAGKSGVIGVIHFGGLSQVAAERVWYASHAIQAEGYQVLVNDVSWSPGGVTAGCEAMIDARVEGVLIAGLNDALVGRNLQIFQRAKIPVVSLSGSAIPRVPQVRTDTRTAFQELTEHLLVRGRHRVILALALSRGARWDQPEAMKKLDWTGSERIEGFLGALTAAGGKLVTEFSAKGNAIEGRIVRGGFEGTRFDPYRKAAGLMTEELGRGSRPDGLICGNDDWAIGAMMALRAAGLRIPEDVAVTGFDNTSVGACLEVPLTTAAQPGRDMAEHAVALLFQCMGGQRVSRRPVSFPCHLIVRASSGIET